MNPDLEKNLIRLRPISSDLKRNTVCDEDRIWLAEALYKIYEGADAILITNDEGVFALTGRIIEFPFLDNKLSLPVDSIFEETLEDEEMDFGML